MTSLTNTSPENLLCFKNRVDISGRVSTVDELIASISSLKSKLDFDKIIPQPKYLELDESRTQPYMGFIAKKLLYQYYLDDRHGEYMPIDAICNAEGRYVEAHPEIQAPNWLASKEEFIDRYENISEGGFKAFYTRTRPFSEHAGKVLFERWADGHQGPLADIIELFEDDELDYLKSCAKKPNAHSWDTSRELFRQCLDKTSPAFADHRLKIWGAVRNAEEETINRLPDGSALLTFTTLGGSADNVIKELSRQHPMMAFAHSWICEGNPQYNGCAFYRRL